MARIGPRGTSPRFACYRLLQEDGAEDESVVLAGMRVKFN